MTKRLNYLLIALAASLMLVIALGRWLSLASNAWDLGIFTQFSWMLSRGYFSEPASLTGWPVLADHASFVLVPISFLYRFWSSPAYLLTFQVFALAGASATATSVATSVASSFTEVSFGSAAIPAPGNHAKQPAYPFVLPASSTFLRG